MSSKSKQFLDFVTRNTAPQVREPSPFASIEPALADGWLVVPDDSTRVGKFSFNLLHKGSEKTISPKIMNPLLKDHIFVDFDITVERLVDMFDYCVKEDKPVYFLQDPLNMKIGIQSIGTTEVKNYWVTMSAFMEWKLETGK